MWSDKDNKWWPHPPKRDNVGFVVEEAHGFDLLSHAKIVNHLDLMPDDKEEGLSK